MERTRQIEYRLLSAVQRDGKELRAGYYGWRYDVTGQTPDECRFSEDRESWTPCAEFGSLGDFVDFFDGLGAQAVRMERMEYVETISYRGVSVPIFLDDAGQCFFCIWKGREESFGTFVFNYEDQVRAMIDHDLSVQVTQAAPTSR